MTLSRPMQAGLNAVRNMKPSDPIYLFPENDNYRERRGWLALLVVAFIAFMGLALVLELRLAEVDADYRECPSCVTW